MRKTAIILVLIISIACLSSCGIQQQLAAPANLRIEDSTIKWNSVEGAMSYVIYADGNEVATTSNTYYNLGTLQFEDGRTYDITVRSRGDGYLKLASTDSISISYTHINKDAPPIIDTDPVVDDSVAKDLFNSGLGYGVNALTAKRAISSTRLSSFFDETQITADFLGSYDIGSSRSKAVFRENIADEIIAINSKLVYGASLEASLSGMFSAGFEEKFSLETAFESELSTHQLYFILNMYVIGKNYQLKNYQQPRAYSDKISEFALKDIQALRNGTLTPSIFFDRYGTHLTMAVSYGGMTEVNYSMQSKEKIDSAKIASSLESKLTASYSYDGVDAEGAASYGRELQNEFLVSTSDTVANLYIESIGKKPLTANTFVDFTTGYTEWAKQFEDDENFRVVDVADGGLVPIWNYFPEEYNDVAEILQNYFNEKAGELGRNLIEKVSPSEDTTHFAGGKGTQENPYLLSTAEHIKNIMTYGPSAYYELANDIELHEWIPLGSYSCPRIYRDNIPSLNHHFSGSINGNNHTLTYTIDIQNTDKNSDYGWGLFGLAKDATFTDIKIDAEIIGTSKSASSSTVAGALVGWADNCKFINCTSYGTISQTHNGSSNEGCVRSGGLVGMAKNSSFYNCVNNCVVFAAGFYASAGGIVGGMKNCTFDSCHNVGKVSASHGKWVFGKHNYGNIYGKI